MIEYRNIPYVPKEKQVDRPRSKSPVEHLPQIQQMLADGFGVPEIAERLSMPEASIRGLLQRKGISVKRTKGSGHT